MQLSESLEIQASTDAQLLLLNTPSSLFIKAKSHQARPIEYNKSSWTFRKLVPAVSVSLAVVFLLVVLQNKPAQSPSSSPGMDSLLLFGRNSLSSGTIQKLASNMESPYSAEWNGLKESFKSAAQHLRSQLDLKIDQRKK